jgi:hypothetical protein
MREIGNAFQNIDRARAKFVLGVDPFAGLAAEDLDLLRVNGLRARLRCSRCGAHSAQTFHVGTLARRPALSLVSAGRDICFPLPVRRGAVIGACRRNRRAAGDVQGQMSVNLGVSP